MNDQEKLCKAALLLGMASGGLRAMYWARLDQEDCATTLYEFMDGLIKKLDEGIEELFYKDERIADE